MKIFTTILFLGVLALAHAQDTLRFEDQGVPLDSFDNGSAGHGGYDINGIIFPNEFNTEFGIWDGWSISSKVDTVSAGFLNQYSAIAGSGDDSSDTYAVSYGARNLIHVSGQGSGGVIFEGFSVCNGTYPFLSMQDGDAFAKKFGGATGDDPDYFLMTVKKYSNGELSSDSVDFYLADFRFEDNAMDYIVKDWTFVDLSSLGAADSLEFTLSSSDVGSFGMNTPAYFCLDNLVVSGTQTTSIADRNELAGISVFPNPTSDFLRVSNEEGRALDITIYDISGRLIANRVTSARNAMLDLRALNEGLYAVRISDGVLSKSHLIAKK